MKKGARSLIVGATVMAAVVAACGGSPAGSATDDTQAATSGESVVITVEPSAIPAFVAEREGFFGDIDVEVTTVGYEEAESLLLAGQTHIAWMGPLDVAKFVSEGEEFRYLSTAGALNMYNGIVVRAEDGDVYNDVTDLVGKRLGIPGFGTGTWATFDVFARSVFDIASPEDDFEIVTADSGALLAMLERGEIDGALLFAAQSAAGRYMEQFKTVFSFTEAMQEEYGVPLVVNGPAATREWIEADPDTVDAIVSGLDQAVAWMKDNPEAFDVDGKYADLGEGDGWHNSEETTAGILALVGEGEWYRTSNDFTDEWQSAVYEIIQAGEGSLVDSVPPMEEIFADAG